jgi:hypothetical protein
VIEIAGKEGNEKSDFKKLATGISIGMETDKKGMMQVVKMV